MKTIWKTLTCSTKRKLDVIRTGKPQFDIGAFEGQLPLFQAPVHRFAICTENGEVFYEDVALDSAIRIDKYIRQGIHPTIEDLGPV